MIRTDRILRTADLLDTLPDVEVNVAGGFNMYAYEHACGTPACVAGWMVHLARQEDPELVERPADFSEMTLAGRWIGVLDGLGSASLDAKRYRILRAMFAPPGFGYDSTLPARDRKYTARAAAAMLRHFAATGEVRWTSLPVAALAVPEDAARTAPAPSALRAAGRPQAVAISRPTPTLGRPTRDALRPPQAVARPSQYARRPRAAAGAAEVCTSHREEELA